MEGRKKAPEVAVRVCVGARACPESLASWTQGPCGGQRGRRQQGSIEGGSDPGLGSGQRAVGSGLLGERVEEDPGEYILGNVLGSPAAHPRGLRAPRNLSVALWPSRRPFFPSEGATPMRFAVLGFLSSRDLGLPSQPGGETPHPAALCLEPSWKASASCQREAASRARAHCLLLGPHPARTEDPSLELASTPAAYLPLPGSPGMGSASGQEARGLWFCVP